MKTIYVVTMYRYGDHEKHSYVLGAYSSRKGADKAGWQERKNRGGNKYMPETLEFTIGRKYENQDR